MSEISLPKDFVTYPEARKQAFMRLKALKDAGRRVVLRAMDVYFLTSSLI